MGEMGVGASYEAGSAEDVSLYVAGPCLGAVGLGSTR